MMSLAWARMAVTAAQSAPSSVELSTWARCRRVAAIWIQKKHVECRSPPTMACHSPALSRPLADRYLRVQDTTGAATAGTL